MGTVHVDCFGPGSHYEPNVWMQHPLKVDEVERVDARHVYVVGFAQSTRRRS